MNGIQCEFVLLSQDAEYRDDAVNVYGITALAYAPTTPFPMVNKNGSAMKAVSFWRGPKNATAEAMLRISGPSGYVQSAVVPVRIGPAGRGVMLTSLRIVLPAYGEYAFEVLFDGQVHASTGFALMPHL